MISVDVTVDIPFTGGDYPFLLLGSITDVPFLDSCPQKKTPFVPRYSCATLSADEMLPYNCKESGHTGAHPAFSQADLRTLLYAVPMSSLFVESEVDVERSMLGEIAPPMTSTAIHRHYDRYPLQSGMALYNGECFMRTGSLAPCTQPNTYERLLLVDDMHAQPDVRRFHVAKIVPYQTFPTTTRMSYHFQYRATQMSIDCPQAVRVTTIFSDRGYVLGFSYRFTLTVGHVGKKNVVALDTREFDVRLLFNSLTGSYVSYGIFIVGTRGAYNTIDVRAADNPLAIYSRDGTMAKLTLHLLLTLTTVGETTTVTLPTNSSGMVALDAFFFSTAPNCVPFTVVSATSENNDKRYCATSSICRYMVAFETPMTTLAADGLTFMPRSCQRFMSFQFPYVPCVRKPDGSLSASCTPNQPIQLHDVQVNLVKYVYPRSTQITRQRAYALVLLHDSPTFDDLVGHLCQVASEANRVACLGVPLSYESQMGDTLAVLYVWDTIDQLSGDRYAPTLFIDVSTLHFQVSGYTLGKDSIGSFVRTLSPASSRWNAFRVSWLTQPRAGYDDGRQRRRRLEIVRDRAGVDGFTLPVSSIKEHIDLDDAFVIQTLTVSAFIEPRMNRIVGNATRRFVDQDNVDSRMFIQTSRTFIAFTSHSCMMTSPIPPTTSSTPCPSRDDAPTYIVIAILVATLISPWFLWHAHHKRVLK